MATTNSESQENRGKRKQIDEKVRPLNSKRRKETLFRKCHELTVKSDVQVSLVCIGSDGEIETWPDFERVKAMLTKHKEEQAEKNGEMMDKSLHESKTEEKEKAVNDLGKLSAESLMTLLRELDSKLETLEEKIKKLSTKKASNFCNSVNNFGSFMEVHALDHLLPNTIESHSQPWVSSVQPNQPTESTEESMAVSTDIGYSFINSISRNSWWVPQNNENVALNRIWEPEIELLNNDMNGAKDLTVTGQDNIKALQNQYLGSNWDHRLQW